MKLSPLKKLLIGSSLTLVFLSAIIGFINYIPLPIKVSNIPKTDLSNRITIRNYAYSAATTTVKTGTTIVWINQDSAPHTVTGNTLTDFKSPLLKKGESYSYTFVQPGTYTYFCEPHPMMKATVVVQP